MPGVVSQSRGRSFLLTVLGPPAVIVGFFWGIPIIIGAFNEFGRDATSSERVALSTLMDESLRRDRLPLLTRLRVFETPDGFHEMLFVADVLDDRVIAVGETKMFSIDLPSGSVGHVRDFSSTVGRVFSVTASQSEIWIHGSGGFVQVNPVTPALPPRVVMLDEEAREPQWFGDRVIATGNKEVLRFYEPNEDIGSAVLIEKVGDPLFPIVDSGLSVFFNLLSFTVDTDQRRIAAAFRLSNRIHVYDRNGALTRSVAGPVEVKLDFDIVPRNSDIGGHTFGINEETRFTYLDLDSDRELIVALFAGLNGSGPGMPRGPGSAFSGDELHVFRWDGTLVGTWRFPEMVIAVRLDEVRQRIYAVREFPFWSVIELDATPLYGWTP